MDERCRSSVRISKRWRKLLIGWIVTAFVIGFGPSCQNKSHPSIGSSAKQPTLDGDWKIVGLTFATGQWVDTELGDDTKAFRFNVRGQICTFQSGTEIVRLRLDPSMENNHLDVYELPSGAPEKLSQKCLYEHSGDELKIAISIAPSEAPGALFKREAPRPEHFNRVTNTFFVIVWFERMKTIE